MGAYVSGELVPSSRYKNIDPSHSSGTRACLRPSARSTAAATIHSGEIQENSGWPITTCNHQSVDARARSRAAAPKPDH